MTLKIWIVTFIFMTVKHISPKFLLQCVQTFHFFAFFSSNLVVILIGDFFFHIYNLIFVFLHCSSESDMYLFMLMRSLFKTRLISLLHIFLYFKFFVL